MRWRSFAAREDLVRSEPPPLPEEGEEGSDRPSSPEILLAFDPCGVPVVLFALVPGGEDRVQLRFAVPRDAGASLREALRLLFDLLRNRGDGRELVTQLPPGTPATAAVLEACGWSPGRERIWTHTPCPRATAFPEPGRAG
jgi:hypothetical protein